MITEESRQETKKTLMDERKTFLRSVIDAAARYERLLSNKDFSDILRDLQKVVDIHNQEIAMYVKILCDETNLFKRMRVESVLRTHQIRKDQLLEAIVYPTKLVSDAVQAREELSKIKTQEESVNGYNRD